MNQEKQEEMKGPNAYISTKATDLIWTLPKTANYVIMIHRKIWNIRKQKKDKFKQRKLKPSANFQVQQSIKICCQLSRKPRNNPRRNTAAEPFSSPYFFSRDLSYISTYTNSICFILPFLLDIHPPHHDINHFDIVTIVEHQQGFLTWLIAQVSYKISKCIRLFSLFLMPFLQRQCLFEKILPYYLSI